MSDNLTSSLGGYGSSNYGEETLSDPFNDLTTVHMLRIDPDYVLGSENITVVYKGVPLLWKEFWNEMKEISRSDMEKITGIFWSLFLTSLKALNRLSKDKPMFHTEKIYEYFYKRVCEENGCQELIPLLDILSVISSPKRRKMGEKLFQYCIKGDRLKVYRLFCKFSTFIRLDKIKEWVSIIKEPLEDIGDKLELEYFLNSIGNDIQKLEKTKIMMAEAINLINSKGLNRPTAFKTLFLDQLLKQDINDIAETLRVDFYRFSIFKREIECISLANAIKIIIERSDATDEEKSKLSNETKIIMCGNKDVKKSLRKTTQEALSACSCLVMNRIQEKSVSKAVSQQVIALKNTNNPLRKLQSKRIYEAFYYHILGNSAFAFRGISYSELIKPTLAVAKKMACISYSTYNPVYLLLENCKK